MACLRPADCRLLVRWLALGQLIVVSMLVRLPFFPSDQQCLNGVPISFQLNYVCVIVAPSGGMGVEVSLYYRFV
ncbi:unnamed protein product [Rodentolepis nana]|uniref:Secreted protein n=1 Tax=Rodentolepis nana TaxID=102285 RepID=A0A0R3TFR8_RODNA|nr:unnamed protein product [Rodentolepis nana]